MRRVCARRPSLDTIELLRERVDDDAFRAAFAAKIVTTAGSDCQWWTGAISGRGHGRVFLGRDPDGRPHAIIAHRLAYALDRGVDELLATPILGHRCDNPLCQRVGPGHVTASSASGNRREYLARRILADTMLDDQTGSLHKALRARTTLRARQQLPRPAPGPRQSRWLGC